MEVGRLLTQTWQANNLGFQPGYLVLAAGDAIFDVTDGRAQVLPNPVVFVHLEQAELARLEGDAG